MAKERVPIPPDVAAAVLVSSAHTCCKCEERGAPVQIHHIDEDPSNNDPGNFAVLCLRCHDETQVTGGFARRLSANDVRLYRDQWVARVEKRRKDADGLFVERATGNQNQQSVSDRVVIPGIGRRAEYRLLGHDEALRYIGSLPDILAAAYRQVRTAWSGNRIEMVRAAYDVSEVVQEMWLRLTAAFPDRHFGEVSANDFLVGYVKQRYEWQYALAERFGPGTGGRIAGLLIARGVLHDLETMVVYTVGAIRGLGDGQKSWEIWLDRWNAAKISTTNPQPGKDAGTESASALAVSLERFAIECANKTSSANFEYNEQGGYEHLHVSKLPSELTEAKWPDLAPEILIRVRQLPNEILLAQSAIDSGWKADPGDNALKRSFEHVARAC